MIKIAILDDYQSVALKMADWSVLADRAEITVFNDHIAEPKTLIERLLPFDVVCVMRERTPLPREIIEQLPQLKLIASTARATRRSMWRPRRAAGSSSPTRDTTRGRRLS